MPMLSERTNVDLSNYSPVVQNADNLRPQAVAPSSDLQPGLSPYIRCPLPPIWMTSPDSLRSFYSGAVVPQNRLFNPPTPTNNSTGTVDETVSVSTSGSSSGGGGGSTSIAVSQSAVVTPSISPNMKFVGSISISRVYQLIQVSASAACRVELYGNAAAQSTDLYRGIDVPPPAGSTVNLITDVVMDTSPFQWSFQDRSGSNQDTPRTALTYITVTNLSSISTALTVTITYAPLVT